MLQQSNFKSSFGVAPAQEYEDALRQLLVKLQADWSSAVELPISLETAPAELGAIVGNQEPFSSYLYWVVKGKVRLLHENHEGQRWSLQLLSEGDFFGGGLALSARSCSHLASLSATSPSSPDPPVIESASYLAVAATPSLIARITLADLKQLQPLVPDLPSRLQQQAQRLADLVFFRGQVYATTPSVTSAQVQSLLAELCTLRIAAGEADASALSQPGYYWLRQGQLNQPEADPEAHAEKSLHPPSPTPFLSPGMSWIQTSETHTPWVPQSDVVIYQLPPEQWEALSHLNAELLPLHLGHAGVNPASPSQPTHQYPSEPAIETLLRQRQSKRPHLTSALVRAERPQSSPSTPDLSTHTSNKLSGQTSQDFLIPQPRRRPRLQPWHRYPFLEQQSTADCGPTCIAIVALYWGHRLNLNRLREMAQVGRSGASLKHLAAAAEKVGFQGHPVRASLGSLREQQMPWIAHWQGNHYVVVYRIRGHCVLLADPARGKSQISQQQFLEGWTGYALLLEPTPRLKQSEAKQKASLRKFWQVLWPYRAILGQIIALSLLMHVFGLVMPVLNQVIMDQVLVQKSMEMLNILVIGAFCISLWNTGMGAIRQYLLDYFSNRLNLTLISAFVHHTLRLPLGFFEQRQVGDIITRVQENRKIQAFLMRQAIATWMDVLMASVYLALMFYYNSRLALLVVALLPPLILLTLLSTPFLKQLSREVFNESAEQNSLLVEMLTGVATIKAAAAEQEIRWRWEDRLTQLINTQFKAQKLVNILSVLSGTINTIGSLALLWYGSSLVIQGELSIGQLVAFNLLIGRVLGPCISLVGLWDEFQEVLIAVERLNDVLESEPEDSASSLQMRLPPLAGEVQFENVTFRYAASAEQNILQNLSFQIQPGQTVAIVGRSGSGKSTLVKLLQGIYRPTTGRIFVDGHDISLVAPDSLRWQLGVVPQECFLFSGTILDNIRLYRETYSLERVVAVAKLAEAHSFIQDLPLGYSTQVGERGANLSGGQRQRIAIARALLGAPPLLILDEATSSLDTESERRFQQNLTHLSQGRTTFMIAHRLSTVRDADQILVLDKGVLIEQGDHNELIEKRGLYYHLAQQQLEL